MQKVDNLTPELRSVVHDWGFCLVDNFMMCGVTNAKHIRHLINLTIMETRTGGGSVQTDRKGKKE